MSMEMCRRLYMACLSGAVLCVSAAVVLFIRLDIRTAWSVLARGKYMSHPKAEKGTGGKHCSISECCQETEPEEETRTMVLLQKDMVWEIYCSMGMRNDGTVPVRK